MDRPNWKDAPEWANFVAMDDNKDWYWFEFTPIWDSTRGQWMPSSGRWYGVYSGQDSLEKRPK